MRADFAASVATGAARVVDGGAAIRRIGNRINGTMLRAKCAAVASVVDAVTDERGAFSGGTFAAQVGFVFFAVVTQRGQHRVRRGSAQSAEARCADLMREVC